MQIQIDEKVINITNPEQNLVQIAREYGIAIPAPCFFAGRHYGCCQVCAVEIDNTIQYACGTKPQDGMQIIVNREDLKELRKMRMKLYKRNILQGTFSRCGCSNTSTSEKCGCGEGCC